MLKNLTGSMVFIRLEKLRLILKLEKGHGGVNF